MAWVLDGRERSFERTVQRIKIKLSCMEKLTRFNDVSPVLRCPVGNETRRGRVKMIDSTVLFTRDWGMTKRIRVTTRGTEELEK